MTEHPGEAGGRGWGLDARYDAIGGGYATTRREDPAVRERIRRARRRANRGQCRSRRRSYEPSDRYVIAIEPSDVMAAQRPWRLAPAIRAAADSLPLRNDAVDAAMAILTIHHWDNRQQRGVDELRRVARGPVVILTYDPAVSGQMWLMRDYLPEVAELDHRICPPPEQLAAWLTGEVTVEPVLISADTPDWTLASFWAHPERVLDKTARQATSGFARMTPEVVQRVVTAVAGDLETGVWDERHGELRNLTEYDAGLRLVIAP